MTSTFQEPRTLRELSESYVGLALALGQHDPDYVDAYFGPEEWAATAKERTVGIAELESRFEHHITRSMDEELEPPAREQHRYLAGRVLQELECWVREETANGVCARF